MPQSFKDPKSGREEIIDGRLTSKGERMWLYTDANGVDWRIEGQADPDAPAMSAAIIWKAFVVKADNKYGITTLDRAKMAADDLLGAIEAIDGAAYQFKVKAAGPPSSGFPWWLLLLVAYAMSKKGKR